MPPLQQTPPAPAPVVAPQPYVVTLPGGGTMAAADVQGLRVKLNDLRDGLQDAASRRRTVAGQLESAEGSSRSGLESRLAELDARILGIEKEITATELRLANVPPALLSETAPPDARDALDLANQVSNDLVPIVAILSVFVLAPFTIAISRWIWRRGSSAPRVAAVSDAATQQKLEQLQQAVDTIAIEVERISEGQRFVTKLMSERALGAGAAEPLRAPKKSAIPSERG